MHVEMITAAAAELAGIEAGLDDPRRELADGPCEHRIGEYEDVVDLYEHRRMTDPQHGEPRIGAAWIADLVPELSRLAWGGQVSPRLPTDETAAASAARSNHAAMCARLIRSTGWSTRR